MRILAALLALMLALPAAAVQFEVRVGNERITLDTPPGYGDTSSLYSPRMQDLADSMTSASNRVLLFAISDLDLRRFMTGDKLELRRYMMAATPRGMERFKVNEEQFKAFVTSSLRDLGPVAPKEGDLLKYLEKQTPGKANLLAELKKEPTLVSILQATRLPDEGGLFGFFPKIQYVAATTTLLLLRGKAIQLAVYTVLESARDLDWITVVTEQWIHELQRLNK
jgi:hypothetical protein